MRHYFYLLLLVAVCLLSCCNANNVPSEPEVQPVESMRTYPYCSGKLYAYNFESVELGRTVKVDIWVPNDDASMLHRAPARTSPILRFPVIYMHDGQNCIKKAAFSNHAWEVDKVVTELGSEICSPIVVMIYCNDASRNADYMPANWWELLPEGQTRITVPGENTITKANSKEYIDFITNTLKPWVDYYFPTYTDARSTIIAGSSMGALVSIYGVQYRPDVFGCALALSYPSLGEWWDWQKRTFTEQMPEVNSVKLYIDTGTGELDKTFFPYFNDIETTLRAAGWDSEHLQTPIYPGADHNEAAWAKRLAIPLRFALGYK